MTLTPQQHALFFRLVQHDLNGELFDSIIPIPINASEYVIYLRRTENLRIRYLSDLDALAELELLGFGLNRMGTAKYYFVTEIGRKAARHGQLAGASFARLDIVKQQGERLKGLLAALLPRTQFLAARTEIKFVHNLLAGYQPDRASIHSAIRSVTLLIGEGMQGADLARSTQTLAAFSKWSEAVMLLL